jgi:hypothetical protein
MVAVYGAVLFRAKKSEALQAGKLLIRIDLHGGSGSVVIRPRCDRADQVQEALHARQRSSQGGAAPDGAHAGQASQPPAPGQTEQQPLPTPATVGAVAVALPRGGHTPVQAAGLGPQQAGATPAAGPQVRA